MNILLLLCLCRRLAIVLSSLYMYYFVYLFSLLFFLLFWFRSFYDVSCDLFLFVFPENNDHNSITSTVHAGKCGIWRMTKQTNISREHTNSSLAVVPARHLLLIHLGTAWLIFIILNEKKTHIDNNNYSISRRNVRFECVVRRVGTRVVQTRLHGHRISSYIEHRYKYKLYVRKLRSENKDPSSIIIIIIIRIHDDG